MSHRILHVLSQRPGLTGSGVALNAIVDAADKRGWTQSAVIGTPVDDPAPTVGGLEPDNIHPLTFPSANCQFALPGMSDVMPYHSSVFSKLSPSQIDSYRTVWRQHLEPLVDCVEPDLIHSHHVWLLSSMLKDIAPETPVVTHCHATGLRQLELCPHLADAVRRGCSRNDRFVVLHAGHAELLTEQLGIPVDCIDVVGSGFAPDRFHAVGRSSDCALDLVYAGKLSRSKGVPWLLDAVEALSARLPGLQLHVAGSGSGAEADSIRDRMNSMRCVTYHGQLDQGGLSQLLRSAAVFVLPSFYEGLPLVLVEAAACGCRLVSTALPGVLNQLANELSDRLECVALPRLTTIDQPLEEDLPEFVDRLASALERSLSEPLPVTNPASLRGLTWDGVFQRIERVWLELLNA